MSWNKVKLSELLSQIKRSVTIDNSIDYKLVTISNKGIIKQREIVKGIEIKGEKAFEIKSGKFIYSRLSVHTGAFGIIPTDLDGAVVTSEMPLFEMSAKILPEFLIFSLNLPAFKYQLEQLTKGVGRTRVKETNFLNLVVDLPEINEQKKIVDSLFKAQEKSIEISNELTNQYQLLKKLRHQLLKDAFQGKLVAQSLKDESAKELLDKILIEKDKFSKENKTKLSKILPSLKPNEVPFEVPDNWVWCRLGEVSLYSEAGKSYQAIETPAGNSQIGVIKTSAITSGYFVEDENKLIPNQKVNIDKIKINKGDIIFCRASGSKGLAGKSCLVKEIPKASLILSDKSIRYVFSNNINKTYIQYFNSSLYGEDYYMSLGTKKSTTMNNITREQFNGLRIPLPPLAEQNRIVNALDNLMEYCDELEKSIEKSVSGNEKLLQQILKEALKKETVEV